MMKKNSERNAAIRFMKKLFILFIPFIALLAVYFLDDPFMVLKNYERYDQTPVCTRRRARGVADVSEQPGYYPHRLLYHGKLLHYGLSMP